MQLNPGETERIIEPFWKCCPIWFFKCVVIGWLGFPVHCLRMCLCKNPERIMIHDDRPCHGVMDSETFCLPLKKNCSPNGKNKDYNLVIPYGIAEVLMFLTCTYTMVLYGVTKHMPFAYIDTATIINHTRNIDEMFMYTGDYNAFLDKNAALGGTNTTSLHFKFTMFDTAMLESWDTSDATLSSAQDFQSQVVSQIMFNAAGRAPHNDTAPTFGNFNDVVIIGNNCFCKGYYPYNNVTELPTLLTTEVCQSKPSYCKLLPGAVDFVDVPASVTATVAETTSPNNGLFTQFCFIAALCRLIYFYWKPVFLKTPGQGWIGGQYGLVFTYLLTNGMVTLRTRLQGLGDTSLGQYQISTEVYRGATIGGHYYSMSAPEGLNISVLDSVISWGNYTQLAHLLVILFSEYAYCVDFTPIAFLKDNLDQFRVKRRERADKMAMMLHSDKQL